MKKLNLSEMEAQIIGSGTFIDGVLCGIGLVTCTTGLGVFCAVVGCARAFDVI